MNKLRKRIIIAGLLMALSVLMFGCGKKNVVTIDKNTIFREESLSVDFPKGFELNRILYANEKLVFSGYTYDDKTWESHSLWGSVNIDGSDMKTYEMKSSDGSPIVDKMIVTDDGNVGMFYYRYEEPEEDSEGMYYGTSKAILELYSPDGKKVSEVNITDEVGENSWVQNIYNIKGNVVIVTGEEALYYDNKLKLIKKEKMEQGDYYDSIYRLKDGSYVTLMWDENGEAIYRFDPDRLKTGDKVDFKLASNYSIYGGSNSGYDLIFRDNTKVLGYNIGDAEPKTILNYIDSDIYSNYPMMLEMLNEREMICAFNEWDDTGSRVSLYKYVKVNPEDVTEKKVISLGCLYAWDRLKKDVIEFNKTNPDVRITIIDYDGYNTPEDWQAGTKKFNSDVASGQAPDIIIDNGYSANMINYSGKGLFADLTKFIDKDEEINKEDLFPNVIEALSNNGKLYFLSPVFYVNTMLAKESVMGGRTSWTIREMIDFEKSLPEGSRLFQYAARNSLISDILSASGTTFVDVAKGKCCFDSDEFIALLEYVKDLPEEHDYGYEVYDSVYESKMIADENYDTLWRNNKVILMEAGLSDLRNFNYYQQGTFGEKVTFIGYPTSEGNGSTIYFDNMYAISSKSSNPDAAWQFIRRYFTKDALSSISYGIPVSMSRFDELAEEAKQKPSYTDMEGNLYEYEEEYYMNGESITLEQVSDEDIARFKEFVSTVSRTRTDFSEILPIIEEEAAFFFEGQKSAKDVAGNIQGRVTIYINEKQ